jgi:hypothetical protein
VRQLVHYFDNAVSDIPAGRCRSVLRTTLLGATTLAATACTQWSDGQAIREWGFIGAGIVPADEVVLTQAEMRAITGGGEDLTIIPSMDGKAPVDIDELARPLPPECRFIFAETATFGPDIEDFRKTTFQNPPRHAIISEGAASYRATGTAREAFENLASSMTRCGAGQYGALLIGAVSREFDALRSRSGSCGRDYQLKAAVIIEVTFCGFSKMVPEIVLENMLNNIPA